VSTTATVNYRVILFGYIPVSPALTEADVQLNVFPGFDSASDFMNGYLAWDFRKE